VWLPADIVAALEWQADKDSRCTGCGQSLTETLGGVNEDQWNAKVESHCDACRALSRAAHIVQGRDDLDKMAGVRFNVWRDSKTSAEPGSAAVSSNGSKPVQPDPQR
jgi:hypothetical protein